MYACPTRCNHRQGIWCEQNGFMREDGTLRTKGVTLTDQSALQLSRGCDGCGGRDNCQRHYYAVPPPNSA